jgi:hypothetical protein
MVPLPPMRAAPAMALSFSTSMAAALCAGLKKNRVMCKTLHCFSKYFKLAKHDRHLAEDLGAAGQAVGGEE